MPKFATKAADNMFCQARYEAAKFNERLSSREGAAEELGVDRTRLARIELGSVTPYPEEVLLMADIYRAPELKGNYCREMCPLGKGMPKIENQDIDRIALRALCSFRKIKMFANTGNVHIVTSPAKKVTEIKKDIQETKDDSKVSEKPEKKDAASKQQKTEKTSTKSSGLNGQMSLFDLL